MTSHGETTGLPRLAELPELGGSNQAAGSGQPPEPADHYDGNEESRSVWVSVDPRYRLRSADISPTWRLRLAPEGLGDALFAAYTSAVHTAQAAELVRRAATGTRRTRSAEFETAGSALASADLDTWLASVRQWTAATDERLAGLAAEADRYAAEDADVREVTGPAGYVTLRLRAGGLTGITANPAGLRTANPNVLRGDVLAAFRAAGLAAD